MTSRGGEGDLNCVVWVNPSFTTVEVWKRFSGEGASSVQRLKVTAA